MSYLLHQLQNKSNLIIAHTAHALANAYKIVCMDVIPYVRAYVETLVLEDAKNRA